MGLKVTFLNERIEMLDASYGLERQAQYDALLRLYNTGLGPVKAVTLYRPGLLGLSMYGTYCNHSPLGFLQRDLVGKTPWSDTQPVPIGGKGASMQQAFLGNLGEAAERLLAALHSGAALDKVEYATYEELVRDERRAVGPTEVPLFAPEQYASPRFGYVPFQADTLLAWIEGSDLLTGEAVLVPAQMVLFHWKRHPLESRIGYATSGGLVFHPDRRRAILHGLYENIERDAVNLRWYCRLPPPLVDVDLNKFLVNHSDMRCPRLSTPYIQSPQVFLNTLDIPIPVFTVITVDRSRRERSLLAGGGAWSRRERALTQAIFEIGQMQTGYSLSPHAWDHIRPDSDVSELTNFYYAPVYYGNAENLPRLSWYTAGNQVVPWDTVPTSSAKDEDEEYEVMMDWLRATGISPIFLDFSSACWPGVWVTKVFTPQLTQAHIPSHPYLGHPRYYELPQRMGLADRRLEFRDLNFDPLPFP